MLFLLCGWLVGDTECRRAGDGGSGRAGGVVVVVV